MQTARATTLQAKPRLIAQQMLLTILFLSILALGGCNTISGAGKDIEATGDAISDTAEETKQEISE